mgnify:CR=1 FL=1
MKALTRLKDLSGVIETQAATDTDITHFLQMSNRAYGKLSYKPFDLFFINTVTVTYIHCRLQSILIFIITIMSQNHLIQIKTNQAYFLQKFIYKYFRTLRLRPLYNENSVIIDDKTFSASLPRSI